MSLLALQAMFHLRRWFLPARKLLRVFRNWDFFLFSFPSFRWSGVEEGVSGCTWYCVPGSFPLVLGPVRGVGVLLDYSLLRASALSLRWLLRELAKGELLDHSGLFCARYAPRLSLTIPRRTLDDVGNCGRLQRIASAFYPLVVPDLWIVVYGWIRELVHGRVVFVDRGHLSRSRSSSR